MKHPVRPYGEIVIRCAFRCSMHDDDTRPPRCDRYATHVLNGYAYCHEHATGERRNGEVHNKRPRKGKPHSAASTLAEIAEYLESLGVPGLCAGLEGMHDGSEGAELARDTEAEHEVSEPVRRTPRWRKNDGAGRR